MLTPGLLGFMALVCHDGKSLPSWLCTCSCLTSQFLLQGCRKQGSKNTWWEGARAWELGEANPPAPAQQPPPPPNPAAQGPALPCAFALHSHPHCLGTRNPAQRLSDPNTGPPWDPTAPLSSAGSGNVWRGWGGVCQMKADKGGSSRTLPWPGLLLGAPRIIPAPIPCTSERLGGLPN